ncbi:DUF1648 domain-containing protein [Bacillus sp. DX1.1]|nr:DUF1648 domain-containing protein [Bacillus sp. DX1.1]
MKKKIDLTCMISSVVCLLPMILSVVLYSDLPEQIPIHWDVKGNPDKYASKTIAAFGLPLFMFVANVIVHFVLNYSSKNKKMSKAKILVTKWLIPVLSLILIPVCLLISK